MKSKKNSFKKFGTKFYNYFYFNAKAINQCKSLYKINCLKIKRLKKHTSQNDIFKIFTSYNFIGSTKINNMFLNLLSRTKEKYITALQFLRKKNVYFPSAFS